ncbi:MAG: S8 family serine peptidase [Phycisphaerales bacterium]|nr:MAG: S8 family serine peptidase [Phycisphaerales bacterium]
MSVQLCISLVSGLCVLVGTGATPDDPDFPFQWGLSNTGQTVNGQPGTAGADVRALEAWDIHSGTSPVVVAVIGRGVDPHPEFADKLLEGHATVGDPFDTLDSCPHDTHLAGIIAAATDNGIGIAGLNGRAWLLPVRVLDGCAGGTELSAAEGIRWAVDHGADVILAAVQFYDGTEALAEAVEYAASHNTVVIAPVGSTGSSEVAFPAAFETCLAVSATTNQDTVSEASNRGLEVDLAAPGQDIWSTWTDGGYAYQQPARDTASASAFVAGVAALLRSYAPQLSASTVSQILIDSADDLGTPGWDMHFGAGRVSAGRALETAAPPALRFEPVESFPTVIPPGVTSSFVVRIAGEGERVVPNSASLFFRSDTPKFSLRSLFELDRGLFVVELPAVACESTLEYFLAANGTGGTPVTDPLDAPARLHSARAIHTEILFDDDFEEDQGWEIVGGDDTSGRWTRVAPIGTSAQPGYDYSPDAGRFCFVTGQHSGDNDGYNDVDGGPVRLLSPIFELDAPDVEVSYARWFHCSGVGQEDFLTVELSRNGGATWATVETVATTHAWVQHSFRLSEFPEVTGDQLRVRFSTADSHSDSLTEAAVDEFEVCALRCSVTPGDSNQDGAVDPTDFGRMFDCWTGPAQQSQGDSCATLDFDRDYHVDMVDYRNFQIAFDPK